MDERKKTNRGRTEKQRSNLIPFDQLTAEQHRAISSKGGKASGIARRAKRERINAEKAKAAAENELITDTYKTLFEAAKLLKQASKHI